MEVASDRSAVREYRTLHQRIIIHELVTNQFLHADPLMECSDRMAAFDVVFRASALFVVHVAVNAEYAASRIRYGAPPLSKAYSM